MKDFLRDITNDSTIVLGGVSRWLKGYTETYEKKWIDISVSSEYSSSLDVLGRRMEINGGTTFPLPIKHQYIIKTDEFVLDVFVQDKNRPIGILVDGIRCVTNEEDINWLYYLGEPAKNKLKERKQLYLL